MAAEDMEGDDTRFEDAEEDLDVSVPKEAKQKGKTEERTPSDNDDQEVCHIWSTSRSCSLTLLCSQTRPSH